MSNENQGNQLTVRTARLPHGEGLPPLGRESEGAAGMDLRAAVMEDLVIGPGQRACIPTGLVMEIPSGYEGEIRPRSGLALRHGLTVLNTPGTIDSDYRGEIKVILINLGDEPFTITRGMRIAQMMLKESVIPTLVEVSSREALEKTRRGGGGFGSTGNI